MMHWMTASEISQAYDAGTLSPVTVIEALFARIDALEPQYHAFIELDRAAALQAAKQAEREFKAGRRLGPLHGVPVGIKDIIDMAGQRTSCHSKVMLEHLAVEDAPVITALRASGAILFGKLALHEFAIGGPSFDLPFPPARNPWNIAHHPGGSSSGSGTALAAGFLPLALGTDTGGSVRHPAAACGLAGLKATYDLVSRRGVYPLSMSLDHVGPMARTVQDVALLLDVMAQTSSSPNATKPATYTRDLKLGVKGLRIGFIRHFHEKDEIAHPDVTRALNEACQVFRDLGAEVNDMTLPSLQEFSAAQKIILMSEGWAIHAQNLRERPQDYAEMSRRKLMCGAFLSAGDYVQAMQMRGALIDRVNHAFKNVDILLAANSLDPACRIEDVKEVVRTYTRQARVPFNLTGHPALAMMSGLSSEGLPVSLQLIGKNYDEVTVLRAGAAFEQATPWHTMHPQLS
ncbi:amidase [Zwartia sp.]|uniref:amidase n=1 Tax=Zwartia sp. TaxID=2978004 RepID=UPI003BB0D0CA